MPLTEQGKEVALAALAERRKNPPKKIDNASLPAGSLMYFYCHSCGGLSDTKDEMYILPPSHICTECAALKELGWLE